jgi:hypothetical protein
MSNAEKRSIKVYYREALKNVSDLREYLAIADSAIRNIGDPSWSVGILKKALVLAIDDYECTEVFERISSLRIYGRI